ncbi:hypothetical protein POM88_007619 [Heracleum sosnowskyi]|uniref:NADH dehydrogenase subunit 6 n=1 Tax=Heracleum sosnowskyi TaxID=360622 RepID=A0AAD8N6M0_9APIA|nr:hypothetical protein POM88_007619 [Heracleum sosnowskyi]
MAQFSSIFILAIVSGATAVSAQLAPAPSPDVGASFALPVSTAFIATSLLICLTALCILYLISFCCSSANIYLRIDDTEVVAVAVFLALGFAFYVFFAPFVGKQLHQYIVIGIYSPLIVCAFGLYIWCAGADTCNYFKASQW